LRYPPLVAESRRATEETESCAWERVGKGVCHGEESEQAEASQGGAALKRRRQSEDLHKEERILREATKDLVFQHGMFLVATGVRAARVKGFRIWIITVTLRYDAGDETYIGDLLYDGENFTFLTEQSVTAERARKLADDPERIRKWNEYRASTLRPGKA
jgi:hypothetical protein